MIQGTLYSSVFIAMGWLGYRCFHLSSNKKKKECLFNIFSQSLHCSCFLQNTMSKQMCVLLRGLPGSGKSTLGEKLKKIVLEKKLSAEIVSTDHRFLDSHGVYRFELSKLMEAHKRTQEIAETFFSQSTPVVIIDNCNLKIAHMAPYIESAWKNNYSIFLYEPKTDWQWNTQTCHTKNTHGVPYETMKRMVSDWESVSKLTITDGTVAMST